MEIRTAEQYLLSEIEQLKLENDELRERLAEREEADELLSRIESLETELDWIAGVYESAHEAVRRRIDGR